MFLQNTLHTEVWWMELEVFASDNRMEKDYGNSQIRAASWKKMTKQGPLSTNTVKAQIVKVFTLHTLWDFPKLP